MHCDLVHALTELGILVRHKRGANTAVLRRPGRSAIGGAVHATRRDSDHDLLRILRVQDDSVQRQPAIARHPAWPVRMIEQAAHERPALAPVPGLKQRRWFHSTIEQFGLVLGAEDDWPNVLERNARICPKANPAFTGTCPALSQTAP